MSLPDLIAIGLGFVLTAYPTWPAWIPGPGSST